MWLKVDIETFVVQLGIFPREYGINAEEALARRLRIARDSSTPNGSAVLDNLHDRTTVGRLDGLKRGMEFLLKHHSQWANPVDMEIIAKIPIDQLMQDWGRQRHGVGIGMEPEKYSWAFMLSNPDSSQHEALFACWMRLSLFELRPLIDMVIQSVQDILNKAPRPAHPF